MIGFRHPILTTFAFLVVSTAGTGWSAETAIASSLPPPMRGMVLTLTMEDPAFSYGAALSEIADLGCSDVSLLVTLHQQNAKSPKLDPGWSVSEDKLAETIATAKVLGLRTTLFPIVLLVDEGEDDWRGNLAPPDLDEWFASYGAALGEFALLAESGGVAMLSVGSEFASLEKEERHWRELCETVRGTFSGDLVYTANWDTPDGPAWWDAVDYMGISGYYELAELGDDDASTTTLTREWGLWKNWLLDIRDDVAPEKKIVFSELGYPSLDGGAAIPWDYTRKTPQDLEEQRRGFEAFIRTWAGEESLAGVFVYTWMDYGDDPARGYSPRGKPAEELIRAWYAISASISPP